MVHGKYMKRNSEEILYEFERNMKTRIMRGLLSGSERTQQYSSVHRNTQEALPLCSHSSAKVVISRMRRMMLFNIIFFIDFFFLIFKAPVSFDLDDVASMFVSFSLCSFVNKILNGCNIFGSLNINYKFMSS